MVRSHRGKSVEGRVANLKNQTALHPNGSLVVSVGGGANRREEQRFAIGLSQGMLGNSKGLKRARREANP